MAPHPRIMKAFHAMKSMGISGDKVKPVLKKLLRAYDKNWDLIEQENYRLLADAIFEQEDAITKESEELHKAGEGDLKEEAQVDGESKPPSKRLCFGKQDEQERQSVNYCDPGLSTPSRKQSAFTSPLETQASPDSCALLMGKIDTLNCEKAALEEKLRQEKDEGQKLQLQISEAKVKAELAEKEAEKVRVKAAEVAKENSELKARLCCNEESIIDKLLESERFQKIQEMLAVEVRKKIAESILDGI